MNFFRVEPGDAALKTKIAAVLGADAADIRIVADPENFQGSRELGAFHYQGHVWEYNTDHEGQLIPASVKGTGRPVQVITIARK